MQFMELKGALGPQIRVQSREKWYFFLQRILFTKPETNCYDKLSLGSSMLNQCGSKGLIEAPKGSFFSV